MDLHFGLPDRFPTKQGLKQTNGNPLVLADELSQTDFQQNKDWNASAESRKHNQQVLPDRFPTKQGLKQKN